MYNAKSYNYMERVEEQRLRRIARVKQVRQQKIIIALGIFITILLCTIFSIKAFVYANENKTVNYGDKMYKSVVIYCGDTVDSIASDNYTNCAYNSVDTFANEIRSINHISKDTTLIPGNYIVIPYFN